MPSKKLWLPLTFGLFIGLALGAVDQLILRPLPKTPIPSNWSAVFSLNSGKCTASIVGPRALLGARHCKALRDNNLIALKSVGGGSIIETTVKKCWSDYRTSLDLKICELQEDVPASKPETIDAAPTIPNDQLYRLFVGGFGCVNGRRTFRGFRIGQVSAFLDGDLIKTSNPGLLCDGDSGGPVYRAPDVGHAPKTTDVGKSLRRTIVAVSSGRSGPDYYVSLGSSNARKLVCKAIIEGKLKVYTNLPCP